MEMNTEMKWEFASTSGGDFTGFNDPVTTTFKGSAASLARESIQNIIDAHDPESDQPSEAEFTLIKRNASDLPDMDNLKSKLQACAEFCKRTKEYAEFFTRAAKRIEKDEYLDILKISDYNTVGLTGDNADIHGNYISLMKSIGSSSKSGSTGGSFGLGKGAYFVTSALRTIFVSSMYGPDKYVFQGKARLSSFWEKKDIMQGNGCFGFPKQEPVRILDYIPRMFRRDQKGTDIYIVGFEDTKDWQKNIIKSIINYFWLSLLKNKLKVNVDQEEITADNLDGFINQYFRESDPDRGPDNQNPIPYYLAYTSSCSKIFEEELETLGKVKLYILQKDDYPKKIAFIRSTGMVIQKKPYRSVGDFAGVFICEDETGNELLRKMENPEHNEWNKENAKDICYEDAKKAEKEISEFIKRAIEQITITDSCSRSEIGGLEEFLSLPEDEEGSPKTPGTQENGPGEESVIEKTKELKEITQAKNELRRIAVLSNNVTKGKPGDVTPRAGKNRKRGGGQNFDGELGDGDLDVVPLENVRYRSFSYKCSDNKINHLIVLKGPEMLKLKIELRAGTDESFDSVNIVEAKDLYGGLYKFSDNRISGLSTGPAGEVKLNVVFDSQERYSLNVAAYADK